MKPSKIKLHKEEHCLELTYADQSFKLPCEYLRVFSPSAEVMGHGQQEPNLVQGKKFVNITDIKPAGHYAIKITFDDGHDTGLYTWQYLRQLCNNQQQKWQYYVARIEKEHGTREPIGLGDIGIKQL